MTVWICTAVMAGSLACTAGVGADITCTVAPAIVVYNGYECGSDNTDTATRDVDTSFAGFNLILADGSENTVNGSHVAKIYKEGTTQEEVDSQEAKKQWKFDGAIDSLISFNISGEAQADGKLTVNGDNEGISSALHMTINGGEITIRSADDAINTSEDGVSVLTINDGRIDCNAGGGKEGDGIDSNGWIVQNGGYVTSWANPDSQDSGVDSDFGIYINGGTLLAGGNMYDEVSGDSDQPFLVLGFEKNVEAGQLQYSSPSRWARAADSEVSRDRNRRKWKTRNVRRGRKEWKTENVRRDRKEWKTRNVRKYSYSRRFHLSYQESRIYSARSQWQKNPATD